MGPSSQSRLWVFVTCANPFTLGLPGPEIVVLFFSNAPYGLYRPSIGEVIASQAVQVKRSLEPRVEWQQRLFHTPSMGVKLIAVSLLSHAEDSSDLLVFSSPYHEGGQLRKELLCYSTLQQQRTVC